MLKRLLSAVFVGVLCIFTLMPVALAEPVEVSVIHTADMRGNIFKDVEKGTVGYGNVLSVATHLKTPLIIDGGNFLCDIVDKDTGLNSNIIYAMNKAGYKFATLGHNDLKYSKAELDEILMPADFKIISSNIMIGETPAFETEAIQTVNGVKTAIFAVTDAPSTEDYTIKDPLWTAKETATRLRNGGSKIIIAVVNTKSTELATKIIEENPSITVIIESGTERFLEQGQGLGRTLIVNTGSRGNAVGVSAVSVDRGQLVSFSTANYSLENINTVYPENNDLEAEMKVAMDSYNAFNSDVISQLSADLPYSETDLKYKSVPLGNFVADFVKEITKADMAIIRSTDITGGLSRYVTAKEANNMFITDDDIEVRKIKGSGIFKIMEIALNKLTLNDSGVLDAESSQSERFLQIAGFTVKYNMNYESGKRIVELVTDSGKKITQYTNKEYTVASLSEIFSSYSEYLTSAELVETQASVQEHFREYLKGNDSVTVDENERIQMTDAKKSYMWIVWTVLICFAIAGIIAYVIALIVMWFNVR